MNVLFSLLPKAAFSFPKNEQSLTHPDMLRRETKGETLMLIHPTFIPVKPPSHSPSLSLSRRRQLPPSLMLPWQYNMV